VLPGAKVVIENPVSGFTRQTITDGAGHFQFTNVPLNPYHLTASAGGFAAVARDVDVRSLVPVNVTAQLVPTAAATTVTVEASDLIEDDPTMHTDIDRGLFDKLPLESQSSSLVRWSRLLRRV